MKKVFAVFSFSLLAFSLYLIFFCGTEEKQVQVKPVSVSLPSGSSHSSKTQNSKVAEEEKEASQSSVQAFGIR